MQFEVIAKLELLECEPVCRTGRLRGHCSRIRACSKMSLSEGELHVSGVCILPVGDNLILIIAF